MGTSSKTTAFRSTPTGPNVVSDANELANVLHKRLPDIFEEVTILIGLPLWNFFTFFLTFAVEAAQNPVRPKSAT